MSQEYLVMIVAGEASADAHAGAMVKELMKLKPGLRVYGVGGSVLEAAGADLILDFSRVGVVGIAEILPNLKRFYHAYKALVRSVAERRPRGVILLDLPDFNLFLAKKIRKVSPETRIIYYISPQVWAWRPGRVKKIAERAHSMLVLFPFEKEIYEREGMDVEFVGHPLRDTARPSKPPGELRDEFGISGEGPVIALLPGSRRAEIERYLPVMAETVARLSGTRSKANFILARATTVDRELIERRLGLASHNLSVISGRACDVLAAADLAVVASGTATLEAALLGTPMVVLGAASWLTYIIVKPLSLVSHFSLPNIIAGREIVPELFQREVNPGRVLEEIEALLDQPEKMATMKEELFRVKEALSEGGASLRAAEAVYKRLWAGESGPADS